ERVGDTDADADQLLELLGQSLQVGAAAGDGDLGEAQGVGLILVEVEGGGELAGQAVHLAAGRLDGFGRALVSRIYRRLARDVDRPLDLVGLGGVDLEGLLDRRGDAYAAPVEHSRELADAAVRDGDRRAVVSDRDGDAGGLGALPGGKRLAADRSQQCERLDVD